MLNAFDRSPPARTLKQGTTTREAKAGHGGRGFGLPPRLQDRLELPDAAQLLADGMHGLPAREGGHHPCEAEGPMWSLEPVVNLPLLARPMRGANDEALSDGASVSGVFGVCAKGRPTDLRDIRPGVSNGASNALFCGSAPVVSSRPGRARRDRLESAKTGSAANNALEAPRLVKMRAVSAQVQTKTPDDPTSDWGHTRPRQRPP